MARITDITETDSVQHSREELHAPPPTLSRRKQDSSASSSASTGNIAMGTSAPPPTLQRPVKQKVNAKSNLQQQVQHQQDAVEDEMAYLFMASLITLVMITVFTSLNLLLYQQYSIPYRINVGDHHFIALLWKILKVAPFLFGIVFFTVKYKNNTGTQLFLLALSLLAGAKMLNLMHQTNPAYAEMEMTPGLGKTSFCDFVRNSLLIACIEGTLWLYAAAQNRLLMATASCLLLAGYWMYMDKA